MPLVYASARCAQSANQGRGDKENTAVSNASSESIIPDAGPSGLPWTFPTPTLLFESTTTQVKDARTRIQLIMMSDVPFRLVRRRVSGGIGSVASGKQAVNLGEDRRSNFPEVSNYLIRCIGIQVKRAINDIAPLCLALS